MESVIEQISHLWLYLSYPISDGSDSNCLMGHINYRNSNFQIRNITGQNVWNKKLNVCAAMHIK